jgi:acyl-CoA thioester hydrolase
MSLEGSLANGVHRLSLRVYYEDTDFSGYVYHANYLKFCERARSDLMRLLGIDQAVLFDGQDRTFIVIRKMSCEFVRPARFDSVITVESVAKPSRGPRLEMQQKIVLGADLLFSAEVTAVIVDGKGRPRRPDSVMEAALAKIAS